MNPTVRFPAFFSTAPQHACARLRAIARRCWLRLALCGAAVSPLACDQGFAPPDEPATGTIVVDITYENYPDAWPPDEEIYELLFVALRFVPKDTTDFLQLNRLIFSDRLQFRVERQTITLEDVEAGVYPYSGVAHKYGPDLFDWRPIGLVEENGGILVVSDGQTTRVSMSADFLDPPPFPPPDDS